MKANTHDLMSSTKDQIIDCCSRIISENPTRYRNKDFSERGVGTLLRIAEALKGNEPIKKRPGSLSRAVSDKNTSETAYQRALYDLGGVTVAGWTKRRDVTWLDMELPVTAISGKARCRSVDLVGKLDGRPILWELKFGRKSCAVHRVDYAIFEALLYLAIVKKNAPELNAAHIFHPGETPFDWAEVAYSDRVAVLANKTFFYAAVTQDEYYVPRLRDRIRERCGVDVLLFQTEDYELGRSKDRPTVPCFVDVKAVTIAPVFA